MSVDKKESNQFETIYTKMFWLNWNVELKKMHIFDSATFSNVYFMPYENGGNSKENVILFFPSRKFQVQFYNNCNVLWSVDTFR